MMRGLYIHIPFCTKKCAYCDFVSFGGREKLLPSYLSRLKKEAEHYKGEKISTVFIGGGTPSLMSDKQISELLAFLHENFDISQNAEITIECNPASLTEEKLKACRDSGINRISVGAQSLSDSVLESIGRCHTLAQLENAVNSIKRVGFDNFNLDLIFALPGQTVEMWRETLLKAVSYAPTHISCYSLTLDNGTPMSKAAERGELILPGETEEREMYYLTDRILGNAGIKQYEISNYAKDGFECKHNMNYWQCGEYIGLGCAAHSYFEGARFRNTDVLEEYLSGEDTVRDRQVLSQNDKNTEIIMLGLRMNKGISINNLPPGILAGKAVKKHIDFGLLEIKGGYMRLTERGRDFCDAVVFDIIEEI